jgi:hypothetical protein
MPDTYIKLSEIPATGSPSVNAAVIVTDGGNDYRVPLRLFAVIDRVITSGADLAALADDAAVGEVKWFVNPARDTLECWEFRASGQWHQIL